MAGETLAVLLRQFNDGYKYEFINHSPSASRLGLFGHIKIRMTEPGGKQYNLGYFLLPRSFDPPQLHPETTELVAAFAQALAEKLFAAQQKYGWTNEWTNEWANDGGINGLRQELLRHIEKGDPLDVAAYAAFLWHHQASKSAQRLLVHSLTFPQPIEQEQAAGGVQK